MTDDFTRSEITSLSYLYSHLQTFMSLTLWKRFTEAIVKRLRRYPGLYVVARFFYRIPKGIIGLFRR
jgi:hypothetical protein